jgi:hypothetical protein
MNRPTSRNSSQSQSTSSSLIHLPFPAHEVNLFNPPKSNPNGNLNSSLSLNATLEEELELESQEQLTEPTFNQPWWNSFFTPWGISAILIVLLANVVSGTIILLQRHWQTNSTSTTSDTQSSEQILPISGPNLAASEFIELNLNTLSTIPYSNSTSSSKKNKSAEPLPEPSTIPPIALSNQMGTDYYYVLTEYTGDRSLELARQQVKNVSLINFPQGLFIYLGAFSEETYAEQFVAQLKKQGIDAYLYPQN